MNSIKRLQVLLLISALFTSSGVCRAEITVALTKGFVKKYKDKATFPPPSTSTSTTIRPTQSAAVPTMATFTSPDATAS